MNKLSLIILLSLFCISINPDKVYSQEWYEGGTLHKGNMTDWHKATLKNKLASSADFIATADPEHGDELFKDEGRLLMSRSYALIVCLNESMKEVPLDKKKFDIATMAASCLYLMGYTGEGHNIE